MLLQVVTGIALISLGSIGTMLLLLIFSANRVSDDESQLTVSHQSEQ
ncbi:hypothetical protein OZX65_04030 [Leuconostocaceae bacterium ESL0723]|nr:hypothetical protein [Lactobacillaceae bacterium L1_55_11]WEV53904.1 hypothetical protein OZX65_04030 [Leuconostocaceae bacterium ESL0723]